MRRTRHPRPEIAVFGNGAYHIQGVRMEKMKLQWGVVVLADSRLMK